ncbi:hypothetical protein [Desulforhabdus sp. TSK]|nr:hypothetical protein [Desulforhabdus sp. TSK]
MKSEILGLQVIRKDKKELCPASAPSRGFFQDPAHFVQVHPTAGRLGL